MGCIGGVWINMSKNKEGQCEKTSFYRMDKKAAIKALKFFKPVLKDFKEVANMCH